MQDREFDQLFKDKLENAEIVPSSDLWSKIETGLAPKKNASTPIFWIAAAAALVLMGAGLLFTKTEKVQLQGMVPLAENLPAGMQSQPVEQVVSSASTEVETYTGTPLIIAPSIDVDYPLDSGPSHKAVQKTSMTMQPVEDNKRLDHINIAEAEPVQKNEGWMSDTHIIASASADNKIPDAVINENDQIEKKGIRNVGDLVNFVVEKVDKREQKFLKFNTDDDDNSSLVGINIGFIKLNSRKHK